MPTNIIVIIIPWENFLGVGELLPLTEKTNKNISWFLGEQTCTQMVMAFGKFENNGLILFRLL